MTADPNEAESTFCIANIGPKQRRLRMMGGVVSLVVAVGVLVLLERLDAPRLARLVALVPLWSAAIAVLQAREKT